MATEEEIQELTAYDSAEEDVEVAGTQKKKETKAGKDTYVSKHDASFREFLLKPELLRAILDCGFEHPSEVQSECIPQGLLGTDVICQAKSGMGKTAVFVLAVLQQLDVSLDKGSVQCLVLCHARELAYQIRSEFDRFKKYLPAVEAEVFYGGVPVVQNRATLKEKIPHVLIGTPGRILQLAEEKTLDLSHLKFFVLDECDQVLSSLDMRKDIQKIFRLTPHQKQVMMFSATLNDEMRGVCKKFMRNVNIPIPKFDCRLVLKEAVFHSSLCMPHCSS